MVSTGVAQFKVYARALLNVTQTHTHKHTRKCKLSFISNFRVITRANIFQTLHLQLKCIAHTDKLN